MSRNAWLGIAGVLVIAAVVLVGALRSSGPGEITIGWIGPLSGEYASYGRMVKAGTEIAVDEVNARGGIGGRKLAVIYEDDQLEPKKGVAAFEKLVSVNSVPVVIQAAGSNVMLAEAPLAEKEKIVLISPTCTSPEITDAGDYVFRIAPSDTYQGKVIADIVRNKLACRSVAILHVNNDYGLGLKTVFAEELRRLGGAVVLDEGFDPSSRDFRTVLAKIRAAKPDALLLSTLYQEAALILKQAAELGVTARFIGGDGCFAPELVDRAGSAAEGMLVVNMHWDPASADPVVSRFVQEFVDRHGKKPEVYGALGYDCMMIVASAIEQGGDTSDAIRRRLCGTKDFSGVTGETSFDSNGDALKTYDLFEVRSGEFVRTK